MPFEPFNFGRQLGIISAPEKSNSARSFRENFRNNSGKQSRQSEDKGGRKISNPPSVPYWVGGTPLDPGYIEHGAPYIPAYDPWGTHGSTGGIDSGGTGRRGPAGYGGERRRNIIAPDLRPVEEIPVEKEYVDPPILTEELLKDCDELVRQKIKDAWKKMFDPGPSNRRRMPAILYNCMVNAAKRIAKIMCSSRVLDEKRDEDGKPMYGPDGNIEYKHSETFINNILKGDADYSDGALEMSINFFEHRDADEIARKLFYELATSGAVVDCLPPGPGPKGTRFGHMDWLMLMGLPIPNNYLYARWPFPQDHDMWYWENWCKEEASESFGPGNNYSRVGAYFIVDRRTGEIFSNPEAPKVPNYDPPGKPIRTDKRLKFNRCPGEAGYEEGLEIDDGELYYKRGN